MGNDRKLLLCQSLHLVNTLSGASAIDTYEGSVMKDVAYICPTELKDNFSDTYGTFIYIDMTIGEKI